MPTNKKSRPLIIALLSSLFSAAVAARPIDLSALETEDMRLIYLDPSETYLAPYVAQCFANSMIGQRAIFGFEPYDKITVLMTDFSDYGNAAAVAVPRNTLLVDIAPVSMTFETLSSAERMYRLMNHELVHIATTDQTTRRDRFFRTLFAGKVHAVPEHPETILYQYLTNPRTASPRWYMEGIAVFLETWMARGLGRAQGAYDEMVFRAMVRDGSHFYDPLGLESEGTRIDFQVGVNSYLYGTRFMSYLAYVYTPEKLIEWTSRAEGSRGYYSAHFEDVFGLELEAAWRDWISFEHEFQQANLQAIRQYPTTPYRDLSKRALGSVSRAYLDRETNEIYAAFRYPGVVAHVGAISLEDGTVRKLEDIKGPMLYRVTALAYDPGSKTLFYTADNTAFRDLMAVDARSGRSRMLLKDARIGDLVFNQADRSLWGVRHLNGIATLVRIPYPYEEWTQIHSFPYGQVLYDLDISRDGRLLSTSFGEINGDQSLRVLNTEALIDGDATPVARFDFGQAVPEGFVFSPDGRYLYGSSYYTGVSNIFRYEIETEQIEAVSNAETGFFRPISLGDDTLVIFHYTGQGFIPARIEARPLEDVSAITFLGAQVAEKYSIVKEWHVGSPAEISLEEITTREGSYESLENIGLENIYPVVEGYKDSVAVGLTANFTDPIRFDQLSITASYSPDSDLSSTERTHTEIKYRHRDFRVEAAWNDANFYDLFGPTERSLKGYRIGVGYDRILIFDEPRKMELTADVRFYGDLERLPDYQNVAVVFDKLVTAELGIEYTNTRKSLGAVDDEKGFRWDLAASGDHVNGQTIPRLRGGFDFGFALPWKHSSIWFRNAAGLAGGARDNPFANFFFGGFGNNYVDDGKIKRYREYYAMPGFDLNEIGGRTFVKSTLEWNLPPVRFRRFGTPGFYVTHARPAFFYTVLSANPDSSELRRTVNDVGFQLDFQFTLLSRLEMTLSLGYAVGFEHGEDSDDEFMLSLKVL